MSQQSARVVVLSVSLGPSSRDHEVFLELEGRTVQIRRVGCDGDLDRALELCRAWDGVADAMGIGGNDIYLDVAGRRHPIRDGVRMARAVRHTPVGDGNRVKALLARRAVSALAEAGFALRGRPALITSAADRWGMAQAMADAGCDLVYADLLVALGLPLPLRAPRSVQRLARVVMPVLGRLPTRFFYPSGAQTSGEASPALARLLERAEIIGGDFLQIGANLPPSLADKAILTNTTTSEDVQRLRARGLFALVTSTPRLEGRSFGTNVMEALAMALTPPDQDPEDDAVLAGVLDRIGIRPEVQIWEETG